MLRPSALRVHPVEAPPMPVAAVTVLCVDDHNLVRECVAALVERGPGLRVAGEARTVAGALECFSKTRPDVTLVSLHTRGLDGIQLIRAIRSLDPRARIVVYGTDETQAVYFALDAGAGGFIPKNAVSADLTRIITEVHGRNGMPPDEIRSARDARSGGPTLTTREVEILELLMQGHRTKAIAATLRISDHTVKAHTRSIYEKLGVQGRAAALTEALRRGFVRLAARQVTSVTRRSTGRAALLKRPGASIHPFA